MICLDDTTCADCDVGDFAKEKKSRKKITIGKKRKALKAQSKFNRNKKRKLEAETVEIGDSTNSDEFDEDKANNSNRKPNTNAFLWGELLDSLTKKYKDVLNQKGIVKFAQLLMKGGKEYSVNAIPADIMAQYAIKPKPVYTTTTTHQQIQTPQLQSTQLPVPQFPMNPSMNAQIMMQAQLLAQAQLLQAQAQTQSPTPAPIGSYSQFYPGFAQLFSSYQSPKVPSAASKDRNVEKQVTDNKKQEVVDKEVEREKSPTLEEIEKDIENLEKSKSGCVEDQNSFAPLPIETGANDEIAKLIIED